MASFPRCWLVANALGALAPASAEPQLKFEAAKFVSGFFGLDGARERGGDVAELSVIGAGFSRTGTKSLEAALLHLGHKVYDTRSMLQLGHVAQWEDAATEFKRHGNITGIRQMVDLMESQGFTATLDFPMNLFAPMFAELRPSSRVVMSVRPSEESWVEAWGAINQVLGIFVCRPWSWLLDMEFNKRLIRTLYDFHWEYPSYPAHVRRPVPWFEVAERWPAFETPADRQAWVDLHRRLQHELELQLPSGRFTTFDVRSGWLPLLTFLGVEDAALAAEPFPRVNDRGSLEAVRQVMDVVAAGLPLWGLCLLLLLVGCARCMRFCLCRSSKAKEKKS